MDGKKDNNCSYYDDLDTNFKLAYELCEQNFSHDEIISMLANGNIPQKQIAALKFDYVNCKNDAQILLDNLTGCDGKIREAVALKINTLLNKEKTIRELFAPVSADIFAAATIDINANICRLVVDSAILLKEYENFCIKYTDKIVKYTKEALEELDKFIFRDKKYVINKQNFKLYWCLEAISEFYEYIDNDTLYKILDKCALQSEYTIREKTAKIILKSNKFKNLREKLQNDENYYVRQILHHPSFL